MRIFENSSDMLNEVARDLAEMGKFRRTTTMQDKDIKGNTDFDTFELPNYSFCTTNPGMGLMKLFNNPGQDPYMYNWCNAEFIERISTSHHNPGEAWKLREEVWDEFRNRRSGRFSYTYNERIRHQIDYLIDRLRSDPWSRQIILSLWDPHIDTSRLGVERVPCSLYYHFIADPDSGDVVRPHVEGLGLHAEPRNA